MKKILLIYIILSMTSYLYASKSIVGVVKFNTLGLGALKIDKQITNHLINIFDSTRAFDIVNPSLLNEQLSKYECTEESCLLSFAKTAGIDLIITGIIDERSNSVLLSIQSYGINAPYNNKIIYKYKVEIPNSGLNSASSEIIEEHAGKFITGLLKRYRARIFIKTAESGGKNLETESILNGEYELYRYNKIDDKEANIRIYTKVGNVSVIDNSAEILEGNKLIKDNDFIFITFEDKAEFLEKFYTGRKEEIVFEDTSARDDILLLLSTAPASAIMPVIAPLGYYKYGDYLGLTLWAVNAAPYLYIEANGLMNRPNALREKKKNISASIKANYNFALYMILCGSMSFVVDAYSHHQHMLAANYKVQPSMNNKISAGYLSLVSGGGGHFYRGYRLTGYLYFHLNNILLYSVIKEFSSNERYDPVSGSYEKEKIDRKKAYAYLGAYFCFKIIEITHAVLLKHDIDNGDLIEEEFSLVPHFIVEDENSFNIGTKFTYRFNL